MKTVITVMFLLVLVSCASNDFTTEDANFREACLTNGDGWMKMSQTTDGQITGPSCYGCMPNAKNHICSLSEYELYRGGGRGDVEGADAYQSDSSSTS